MGYTLEPNEGYGESHDNNREMGYTLEANQGYGESHNNNRDMGYNTLEPKSWQAHHHYLMEHTAHPNSLALLGHIVIG